MAGWVGGAAGRVRPVAGLEARVASGGRVRAARRSGRGGRVQAVGFRPRAKNRWKAKNTAIVGSDATSAPASATGGPYVE